jgi:stage V sporulation protein AE
MIVTDGDEVARKAVEVAAENIGGCTISLSAGNPTMFTAEEIIDMIKQTPSDPVVVMVDDCGDSGHGKGEHVIRELVQNSDIEILGVVAVASNTRDGDKCKVDFSISAQGEVVDKGVDKEGNVREDKYVLGDTLSILNDIEIPIIVGIGDPGKMEFRDRIEDGAPITTRALNEILKKSGYGSKIQ